MFTLKIECSKDFDELHIKFSDGTSVVTTGPEKETARAEPKKESKPKPKKRKYEPEPDFDEMDDYTPTPKQSRKSPGEQLLDTDADWGGISDEVVKKPVIETRDRPVKVADELQNLDI